MGFLSRWFGGRPRAEAGRAYREKDNLGTRAEREGQVSAYWMTRNVQQKFDPYVLYVFDNAEAARQALLELDCIKVAQDTGNLICTEALWFGCYATESGKWEGLICGADLTHGLWAAAKESFAKHGGQRKNDQEPEKSARPRPAVQTAAPSKVRFLREERKNRMGVTMTYRIHKAPDAASAKTFLAENPVTKQYYYIVVETPQGNYARDIQGIYQE